MISQTLIFLTVIADACFTPVHHNPMENKNLYHRDMIFDYDELERNAVPNDAKLWPNGTIPFTIAEGLVDKMKPLLLKGMTDIMRKTCIKFVPWDGKAKEYVNIFSGDGCFSYWGKSGKGGAQPLSLAEGCDYPGVILHELMHSIGFDHELNRSDRDDYIVIYWQNIWPSSRSQFHAHNPKENRLIGKFDYDSIMLYGDKTFSKDGWSKTIKARKKGVKLLDVVKKGKLSDSDVKKINFLYKCGKKQ